MSKANRKGDKWVRERQADLLGKINDFLDDLLNEGPTREDVEKVLRKHVADFTADDILEDMFPSDDDEDEANMAKTQDNRRTTKYSGLRGMLFAHLVREAREYLGPADAGELAKHRLDTLDKFVNVVQVVDYLCFNEDAGIDLEVDQILEWALRAFVPDFTIEELTTPQTDTPREDHPDPMNSPPRPVPIWHQRARSMYRVFVEGCKRDGLDWQEAVDVVRQPDNVTSALVNKVYYGE